MDDQNTGMPASPDGGQGGPADPNQGGDAPMTPPSSFEPTPVPTVTAEEKCTTCGNQASGGNCVPCGQGTMSCTCPPATGAPTSSGGEMGQGGPAPTM